MHNKPPLEDDECIAFSAWLTLKGVKHTHIPNETNSRNWGYTMKMKKMGKAPGVPDFMCLVKNQIIFVEMKRRKGGVVSPEQQGWINTLNGCKNVGAFVCRGFNEAKDLIQKYL